MSQKRARFFSVLICISQMQSFEKLQKDRKNRSEKNSSQCYFDVDRAPGGLCSPIVLVVALQLLYLSDASYMTHPTCALSCGFSAFGSLIVFR